MSGPEVGWLPGTTPREAYEEGWSDGWHARIEAAALERVGRPMIWNDLEDVWLENERKFKEAARVYSEKYPS